MASFAFEWAGWGGDGGFGRRSVGGGAGVVGVRCGFQGVPALQVGAYVAD